LVKTTGDDDSILYFVFETAQDAMQFAEKA